MASKVIDTILNLRDNFSKTIEGTTKATKQFQRQMKMAENQAKQMRESVSSVFSSTGAKILGAAGILGLGEFAKSSIELASNLTEVQNVVDTVFSDSASKINEFATNAGNSFGMSELNAKKFTGVIGAMFKSAGFTGDELTNMSTSLVGLAGDLSSFYNISNDEAFEKLKSGISGESEPLKALGLDISDTATSTYALANGFKGTWATASQMTKEMYRYKLIMEKTKDAQGDFSKTSDSYANRVRTMKMQIQSFGASIATYVLPSLSNLVGGVTDFVKSINVKDIMENKVIPAFKTMSKVIDTVRDNMKTIIPIISGVVGGLVGFMVIGKVTSEVRNFIKVINNISKLTNPFYLLAVGIAIFVAGLVNAYNTNDEFRERVNKLLDKVMQFGDYMGDKLPSLLDSLTGVFQNDLQPALDKISDVSVGIFEYIQDNWDSIKTTVELITGAIVAWKLAIIAVNTWAKIVTVTTAVWSTLEMIIYGITNATSAWEAAQWLLDAAMDANPVGIVCLAIGALILVVYEVVTHFQDFVDWCYKAWDALTNNPVLMFIATILAPWAVALIAIVSHWNEIVGAIKKAYDWLTSWNSTKAEDKTATVNINTKNAYESAQENPTGQPAPSASDTDYGTNPDHSATGQTYWKGYGRTTTSEFGDEAIQLPSGSKVFTAKQSEQLLNNKGSIYIPITIQGNVIGNEDFADSIGQHVYNQVKIAMTNS